MSPPRRRRACSSGAGRPRPHRARARDRARAGVAAPSLESGDRALPLGDATGCHHALGRFVTTSATPSGLDGDPDQPGRLALGRLVCRAGAHRPARGHADRPAAPKRRASRVVTPATAAAARTPAAAATAARSTRGAAPWPAPAPAELVRVAGEPRAPRWASDLRDWEPFRFPISVDRLVRRGRRARLYGGRD